ncbi:MAG: FAD-binding oxidoreductase [Paracoccaceae bacterium]|nr:FAD-binding oxidoreductase [Paracoccaceae bacterium]
MVRKVLVVGGGITGVSIVENLRRSGAEVTLVDRIDPGDPKQTSFGNAGMLARAAIIPVATPGLLRKIPKMLIDPQRPLFVKWGYIPKLLPWLIPFLKSGSVEKLKHIVGALDSLTHDSVEQHLNLSRGTGAEKFIQKGCFGFLYPDEKAFADDKFGREIKSSYGYHYKKLTRMDIEKLDANISKRYNCAAVFENHGWITDPSKYLKALFEHYSSLGGKFIKSEVIDINNQSITLKNGKMVTADKVVIATGAWSNFLAKKLKVKSMVESERGYHLFFKGSNMIPPFPLMISDGKFIATPMDGGLRCAGVVEFGGLKAPPSEAPLNLIRRKIKEVYPDLQFDEELTWMGHRPSTPDSLPLIGSVDGFADVICAFGAQHIGLTVGPKLGILVSDLIFGRRTNFDFNPFKANRFR